MIQEKTASARIYIGRKNLDDLSCSLWICEDFDPTRVSIFEQDDYLGGCGLESSRIEELCRKAAIKFAGNMKIRRIKNYTIKNGYVSYSKIDWLSKEKLPNGHSAYGRIVGLVCAEKVDSDIEKLFRKTLEENLK